MKYVGSKARIAKHIVPIIQSYIDKGVSLYIEPFVGGANVIEHIVCGLKVGFDNNMPLIALLTYVIEGGGGFPRSLAGTTTTL